MIISDVIPKEEQMAAGALGSVVAEGYSSVCTLYQQDGVLRWCKTLKPEFAADKAFQALFRKEFEVGRKLDSPYIVKYLSLDDSGNHARLLMDYVEGTTLRQFLDTNADYFSSCSNLLKAMSQILKGMQCLHEHQAVHLDLSLTNIMLTDINHDVRIIDLGFCYSPAHPSPIGTTAHYGAPELYDPQAAIDARADIYSFGRIVQDIIKEVSLGAPTGEMAEIYKVADRCCNENPDLRYQSAEEVLDMLEHIKNRMIHKVNKSQKLMWVLLTVVLLLLALGAAYFLVGNKGAADNSMLAVADSSDVLVNPVIAHVDSLAAADSASLKDYGAGVDEDSVANTKKFKRLSFSVSGNVYTVEGVSFKMVRVEGGTFRMGNIFTEEYYNEVPVHEVTLSSFRIGETEVTQELWTAVMDDNVSYKKGKNYPVENVTWNECDEFVKRLSAGTGRKFRLPTEAEWEYASRGGNKSRGYMYSGSNNVDDVAWYRDNANDTSHPVKQKAPNELGLYDMSGNVWEWVADWYDIYGENEEKNPRGPLKGLGRNYRGGGWGTLDRNCSNFNRARKTPEYYANWLGLRIVLED